MLVQESNTQGSDELDRFAATISRLASKVLLLDHCQSSVFNLFALTL